VLAASDEDCKPWLAECIAGTYESAAPTATSDRDCTVCAIDGSDRIIKACADYESSLSAAKKGGGGVTVIIVAVAVAILVLSLVVCWFTCARKSKDDDSMPRHTLSKTNFTINPRLSMNQGGLGMASQSPKDMAAGTLTGTAGRKSTIGRPALTEVDESDGAARRPTAADKAELLKAAQEASSGTSFSNQEKLYEDELYLTPTAVQFSYAIPDKSTDPGRSAAELDTKPKKKKKKKKKTPVAASAPVAAAAAAAATKMATELDNDGYNPDFDPTAAAEAQEPQEGYLRVVAEAETLYDTGLGEGAYDISTY
jgi:flagellar basal body-associated protein FliL